MNADGSKIVITADQRDKQGPKADSKFYIYDVLMDNFIVYEMPTKNTPLLPYCDRKDRKFFAVSSMINKNVAEVDASGEGGAAGEGKEDEEKEKEEKNNSGNDTDDEDEGEKSTLEFHTFFVTSENGVRKQDVYPLDSSIEGLFGKIYGRVETCLAD